MRVRSLLVLALAAAALVAPGRAAAAALVPCGNTPGLQCTTVDVPLDRTSAVPGTVSLHVEELPAPGLQRGTLFLIAGGPGQGSAHVFHLGNPDEANFLRTIFPGYALVAFDNRGTGDSGLIRCNGLQTATFVSNEQAAVLAGQCGAQLGATASFYSTREHAEDMEAVRQALGLDKIALYGVSYGTKLALAYALAHPGSVERIVLDSVVPPTLPDPYRGNVLRALPATLARYCPGASCRAATANFASEFVALANRIEAKPLTGLVPQANGKKVARRLNGEDLLNLVNDIDLNAGLAAEFPAAVHAAVKGNPIPLLRLFDLDYRLQVSPAADISYGLYAATTCADGLFPWEPATPIEQRPALLQSAVDALPPGTLGPFGKWAAATGSATFCKDWPSPAGKTPLGVGPLPNVPMLAVAGALDIRTPVDSAAQIVSLFPQGHLLVAPGTGHSVLSTDFSLCTQRAVANWIQTGSLPASCPRAQPLIATLAAFPASLASLGAAPLKRAVTAAQRTIRDAEATWFTVIAFGSSAPAAGIAGGRILPGSDSFRLSGYSTIPGVTVSGQLKVAQFHLPLRFSGKLTFSGSVTGTVTVADDALSGTLAGRRVGARS